MGELRFVGPPRRKGPAASLQVLLTAGALVIAAAAFLLGRLSVNTPPPAAAPVPVAAPPAEPATTLKGPAVAQVLSPSPFAPAGPSSSSQVFTVPTSTPSPLPAGEPERTATPTLRAEMARCLSFSVSRDDSVSITYGLRVKIEARNSCGVAFSGTDVAFEVRALSLSGGGLAGRERGAFQSTIPPRGTAETLLHIRCDADRAYRFEAGIATVP